MGNHGNHVSCAPYYIPPPCGSHSHPVSACQRYSTPSLRADLRCSNKAQSLSTAPSSRSRSPDCENSSLTRNTRGSRLSPPSLDSNLSPLTLPLSHHLALTPSICRRITAVNGTHIPMDREVCLEDGRYVWESHNSFFNDTYRTPS